MGTSLLRLSTWIRSRDHPHAYGDKTLRYGFAEEFRGSSPRVWGQVCKKLNITVENRIIPTRMGTRELLLRGSEVLKDHPHAYGDKYAALYKVETHEGSSPRVWGQDNDGEWYLGVPRIIPTRMGTSIGSGGSFRSFQDHPHAYGDKSEWHYQKNKYLGSSPRVWGQVGESMRLLRQTGIIPTRMGTRGLRYSRVGLNQDHPHAYGDKLRRSN